MAKTNKQLQAEVDELIIERNNLIDENEKLEQENAQLTEKLWLKSWECEWLLKANETIVKAHNDLEHENKRLSDLLHLYDNKDWKEHSEEQKIKELELDKKDLHKRLIEWLQINIEKVEKIWELENKVDEQFKVITKYEKELEEQDKEIETLRQKNRELEKSVKWLDEICEKRRSDCFKQEKEKEGKDWQITFLTNEIVKLEYKLRDTEKNEELKLKARKLDLIIKLQEENEVIKQDKANLLAELTRQINEKSALRKENKRLKKRRREWRYNPKKVYEKLARWWLCYIPEWDYLPTKVHESLIEAMEEWHRLASKTKNTVYIVWTYCKI